MFLLNKTHFLVLVFAGTMSLMAQNYEPPGGKQSDGKTIPQAIKVDEDTIRIGEVLVNHKQRTVSFPAKVNMKEGIIEFLVSMPAGKIHEALLITEADPLHLSVGMKLLKFESFEKFFPQRDDDLNWLPFTPPERKEYEKAFVQLEIEQIKDGKPVLLDLGDWLLNAETKQPFPEGEWLYTNSWFYRGAYQASLSGDLVAIFADLSSPINYVGDFNDGSNDSGWIVNPKHTVPVGTDVRVIISQKSAPAVISAKPSIEEQK